ncbi:MAG TPA: site-2 protease family protein [Pyrinomonadaceae bacterium]|nr:site-2 protease family protein [Pyrinomonadaceae bacterium]
MLDSNLFGLLIIYIVVLLFAISAHEAAHAWMSHRFGDDTAYLLGRVTLNPVAHTDPVGTLLIPIVNFIGAAGFGVFIPLIGWGKPTPVNPLRWRNKDTANVMVSLAGIMVNTLIAVIAFIILKTMLATGTLELGRDARGMLTATDAGGLGAISEPIFLLLSQGLFMNLSLAIFNLLPIPPLDGSKVLYTVLPASAHPTLETLEQYSMLILIAAVWFGVVGAIIAPVRRLVLLLLLA